MRPALGIALAMASFVITLVAGLTFLGMFSLMPLANATPGVAPADRPTTTDQMAAYLHSLGVHGGPSYLVGVADEACQYLNAGNGPELAQKRLWAGEEGLLSPHDADLVVSGVIAATWCNPSDPMQKPDPLPQRSS